MKGRESGMPDEDYWNSFFDAEGVIRRLFGAAAGQGQVVEFGCGYGTFTFPAARYATGTVYAFDIEPDLIRRLQTRAQQQGILNIVAEVRDVVAHGTGLGSLSQHHVMIYNLLHNNSALNHALRGDYGKAELEYRNVIELNPKDRNAYIGLGILLTWRGALDEAARCFEKAIALESGDAVSYMRLGGVYLKKGDYRQARQALERAERLDPNLPEVVYSLGMIEARSGNLAGAADHFTRAAQMRPTYAEAHLNLGVARMQQGQIAAAVEAYVRAAELDPENARIHLYLSDAYAQLGQADKSRFHRDQFLRLSRDKGP